jgi:hypothetical protein
MKARDLVFGDLAVELPTGAWKERDHEGAINDPGLQPGSGTVDLAASVQYARSLTDAPPGAGEFTTSRSELFVAGSFRRNGESDLDYRLGDDAGVTFGWRAAGSSRVTWSVQVNARRLGRDEFRGQDVPSTGSTSVTLTPGVRLGGDLPDSLAFSAHVQYPIHQDVNESQLAPRWALILGLSRRF